MSIDKYQGIKTIKDLSKLNDDVEVGVQDVLKNNNISADKVTSNKSKGRAKENTDMSRNTASVNKSKARSKARTKARPKVYTQGKSKGKTISIHIGSNDEWVINELMQDANNKKTTISNLLKNIVIKHYL